MKKEPYVSQYLDEDEQALIEAIEADDYEAGPSLLTAEALRNAMEAAQNTINEKSEQISIRIAKSDLARVKAQALRDGVKYQALIKSIIHQAVTRS